MGPIESTFFRVRLMPPIRDDLQACFLHLLLYPNVLFDAVPRDTKISPESFKNRKHVRRTKSGSVKNHAHLLESCVVEQLEIQHSAI